jgi:hypothetical protein
VRDDQEDSIEMDSNSRIDPPRVEQPPARKTLRTRAAIGRQVKPVRVTALAGVAFASLAIAICGGFSATAAAKTSRFGAPIDAPCQRVAAVLSDGPDPDADPVGYAQAQVRQLRALKISNKKLKTAVDELATAYLLFYKSNGESKPAKTDVKKASKAVNAICPGAAS